MRSSRNFLFVVLLAACGTDATIDTDTNHDTGSDLNCETSYLTYDNFGEPFIANWCRGCHSSALPMDMRQKAPMGTNFDTVADVRTWSDGIVAKAGGEVTATMPPAGGPSESERSLLTEWIECGAP